MRERRPRRNEARIREHGERIGACNLKPVGEQSTPLRGIVTLADDLGRILLFAARAVCELDHGVKRSIHVAVCPRMGDARLSRCAREQKGAKNACAEQNFTVSHSGDRTVQPVRDLRAIVLENNAGITRLRNGWRYALPRGAALVNSYRRRSCDARSWHGRHGPGGTRVLQGLAETAEAQRLEHTLRDAAAAYAHCPVRE